VTDAIPANPLLDTRGLPRFDAIEPAHVVPAMQQLLGDLENELASLENDLSPSWEGLVVPLEQLGDRFGFSWGIVGHLMGVQNSDALREAQEAMLPEVVQFGTRMAQSPQIFRGLNALHEGEGWQALDATQRRIVEVLIRDARMSGVGLEGDAKERFNAIQVELAELATTFSNHVLDGTKAFTLDLTDPGAVDGLPATARALAAQAHDREDATPEAGPWRITLDAPSVIPFLQHARRRDLRETLYRAYISIAGSGEFDNAELIERILVLRREEAQLLGFNDFAEVSLAVKMAPDVTAVERLLEELRSASFDAAGRELAELREFAAAQDSDYSDGLNHWDISFWSERLREERYAYTDEELRPYFSLERVLDGLFGLAQRLFGVRIEPADGDTAVWHPDVRFFRVHDAAGVPIAAFFLDPYSRPEEKRGGAWMDECVGRTKRSTAGAGVRQPVAYLVCNQTPPVGDTPSLMTFGEVETLFHEFGHGLQHMLTRVDEGLASGIRNVEWDAVELPSQFMENWCYDRDTLMGLAVHFETGEPLPEDLFEKIRAARTYRAGSATLRQVFFALTDLELHSRFQPGGNETCFDVEGRVAQRATVLAPLPEDRFLCKFGHIFGGGYAAGYYSYKWAEVLSADAFAAFEEAGLDDESAVRETGRRFSDTVLGLGGSQKAMDVFVAFRGREPSTEPLLRHSGLEGS
jgi:oligopeptidase A